MISSTSSILHTPLQISSYDNLRMVIYVLGRPAQGEMIVTTLLDGEEVRYSMLTDCYITSKQHAELFANWCRKIGVHHFDAMIFTHPDEDHCTGICEVVAEMDPMYTTEIFIPNQMFAVPKISKDNIIEPFRQISDKYDKKGKLHFQMRMPREPRVMFELQFQVYMQAPTIMQFIQIATDERYVGIHNLYRETKASHNDLSLVYAMCYNGQKYLYCADLPGDYLRDIDDEYFHNVRFVKVPHHGSDSCKELPSRLLANEQKDVHSVTTTFHGMAEKRRLPNEEVLKKYCKTGDVYCTGPQLNPLPEKVFEFGGVKMSWELRGINTDIECCGNAYKFEESTAILQPKIG